MPQFPDNNTRMVVQEELHTLLDSMIPVIPHYAPPATLCPSVCHIWHDCPPRDNPAHVPLTAIPTVYPVQHDLPWEYHEFIY